MIKGQELVGILRSHPSWVRELKLAEQSVHQRISESHPSWVRELKLDRPILYPMDWESHPSWVRELKHALKL